VKVYVLTMHYEGEDAVVTGVFQDPDAAMRRADESDYNLCRKGEPGPREWDRGPKGSFHRIGLGGDWEVTEWELK